MKFILTTNGNYYSKEEASRLEKHGFEFKIDETQVQKPYRKITESVIVHVGDLHALMGLVEQLGTVAVQGPSTSTTNYSLYSPAMHRGYSGPVEPQINVIDDYD